MNVFQIIVIAVLFFIEIALTPIFVQSMFPEKTNKSLFLKMILSTDFLLIGIFSKIFTGNTSIYSNVIIIALSLAWIGDLFLEINGKEIFFVIGGVFFMLTHFSLIYAFTYQAMEYVPTFQIYGKFEVIVTVVFIVFFEIYNKKKKINLKGFHIPVLIYAVLLSTMLSKAYIFTKASLMELLGLPSFIILIGAILFFMSDFTLTYTILDEEKSEDKKYRLLNSYYYFLGEALIASTILFIK